MIGDLPCCIGCGLTTVFPTDESRMGADGDYTVLCENCGHSMTNNGRQGVRDLTRAEWKALPDKSWFETWKEAREKIVERMIG